MAKSPFAAAASAPATEVPPPKAGEVTCASCSPVARTMGWLPPSRSMSDKRRCPSAMPSSRYCPSPSGPRCAMTSHMAFNVGKSASTAPVNPQIPHIDETLLLVSYAPMIAQRGETPKRRLAISPKPQIPTDCPARATRCTFCQNVPTTGGFVGIMMHPGRERASFGMNARLVGLLLWRPSRAASRPACVDPRGTNRLPEVF